MYEVPKEAQSKETKRLQLLKEWADPKTRDVFAKIPFQSGWKCLEVGAGQGSVATILSELVGENGSVLATDIELSFIAAQPANVEIKCHDITTDPLPSKFFDLCHARATLQHVDDPHAVLAKLVSATRPGGWVVIEDSDWIQFDAQQLPDAFRTLYRTMRDAQPAHHPNWGRETLPAMHSLGLKNINCEGQVRTMYGGTDSCEWLILGLEWAIPACVEAGLFSAELAETALNEVRNPNFSMLAPMSIGAWGQVPA